MVTRMLLAWLLLASAQLMGATLSAWTDRQSMPRDEHLVLTLKLVNSDTRLRAEGENPNVDLSPLTRDFELGIPRSRHYFDIDRPEARSTSELRIELFPRRVGDLVVPSFSVDGLSTQPITIHVLPATSDEGTPAVFVRHGATRTRPFVHEAIVVYLDFHHRIGIRDARLDGRLDTEPLDVDIERLPPTTRNASIDGLEYRITRMAWAVSARHPGRLKLRLPAVWYETSSGRRERLPPGRLEVEARPLPAAVPAGLLVGRPELTSRLDPPEAIMGRPIAWTITLRAPSLPARLPGHLPRPTMPAGIDVYEESPEVGATLSYDDGTGIRAERRYPLTIVPRMAGAIELPAIEVPYFDPGRAEIGLVRLPPKKLEIHSAATPLPLPAEPPSPLAKTTATPSYWHPVAIAATSLWLATLAWFALRHRRRHGHAGTGNGGRPGPGDTTATSPHARLLAAMGTRTYEAGLRRWSRLHGPDHERDRLVRRAQEMRYRLGVDGEAFTRLVDEILARLPTTDGPPVSDDVRRPPTWTPEAFDVPPRRRVSRADESPASGDA